MVQGAASTMLLCKMAEMEHLHADANLGRSQAHARSLSHGCHHVGHQFTQLLGAKYALRHFASHLHVLPCEWCPNAGGLAVLQASCADKGSSMVSRPCGALASLTVKYWLSACLETSSVWLWLLVSYICCGRLHAHVGHAMAARARHDVTSV